MRMYSSSGIICFFLLLLCMGCNSVSPEKCFEIAVLNSNMLVGFANQGQLRELESPSVKMSKTGDAVETMKRSEVIQSKVDFLETNLKKLQGLSETEDTQEVVQASIALHEYILPVYKTEYQQLARLYDQGASDDSIQAQSQAIKDRYAPKFDELYNKLIGIGKLFAERHNIKVNWAM